MCTPSASGGGSSSSGGGGEPSSSPPPPPSTVHTVSSVSELWSRGLCDRELNIFRQMELSATLLWVPLDVESFLQGSKGAYVAVSRLMYERQWAALTPLVSADCLSAMQEAMYDYSSKAVALRAPEGGFEDAVNVQTAVLHRIVFPSANAEEGEGGSADAPRESLLSQLQQGKEIWAAVDVRFVAEESFELIDEANGNPIDLFAQPRTVTSVWRFEGCVGAPDLQWKLVSIY